MTQAIGMHSTEAFASFLPSRRQEKTEHRSVSLKIFIFFVSPPSALQSFIH